MPTKMITLKENNSGFALLLTLVIITIILAVGLTMLQITMKQLSLSAIARESEIAFYAASTGIECMQYWRSFPPVRAALLKEDWDGIAYDPNEPVYLQCADSNPISYEEITNFVDQNVYGYKYSYNLSHDPLISTDDTCVETSMYLMSSGPASAGTTIVRSFEGNQGPWEDYLDDARAPTLVTNVTAGDNIRVDSAVGTFSLRIYNGVDEAPRQCIQGVLSFTDSSNNQISKLTLNSATGGVAVPSGATRAYVSVDDSRGGYFDNSGNRDSRTPCSVTFTLNPASASATEVVDISDLNEGLDKITCDGGTVCTTIFSRGYNRPCGEGLNSIFTVQRELTIEY